MVRVKKIIDLLDAFHLNKVQYVHWKSNLKLDQALSGSEDLDILVDPKDKKKILKLFRELQIIRGFSRKDSWQPSVYHYFGFDFSTTKIFHVHLHFELPIGFDYNKNYILPIRDSIFKEKITLSGVYVPCPEHEYILLVLRLIIKNACTPFLLSSPIRQYRLIKGANIIPKNALDEFNHLKLIINRKKLMSLIKSDFKYLNPILFKSCEAGIKKNRSIISFLTLANKLKKQIKPYRNNSELKTFILSFIRINTSRCINLSDTLFNKRGIKGSKTPEFGGKIFAFIGGDGAGKSTNIKKLKSTLSKKFKTISIHMGKPKKGFLGWILYYLARCLQKVSLINLGFLIMSYRLSIDRKRAFKKATKLRDKGIIVILDRLPTQEISAMDSPRIDELKYPILSSLEKRNYSKIGGVDTLFVMRLDPEIALKRRPDDNPESLRNRSGQIWEKVWNKPYQIEIDTGKLSFSDVEQKILNRIWLDLIFPFCKMELVGVSGVGKSTINSMLKELYPNSRSLFYKRDFWRLTMVYSIKNPLGLYSILIPTKKNLKRRVNFNLKYNELIVNLLLKNKNQFKTNYFLDQNILYYNFIALKENYITMNEAINNINKTRKFFDFIILLTGSKKELFRRIKKRNNKKTGRAKDMNYEEYKLFYDEYELAFKVLSKTKLDVLEIDTVENLQKDVISLITQKISDVRAS